MPNPRKLFDLFGLILLLTVKSVLLTQDSVEKGVVQNNAVKEQSSNQISVEEEKKAKAEDQLYYLPLQTVFGETHTLVGAGSVSTTLPPHISVEPAPIQTKHQESTSVLYEDNLSNAPASEYKAASQCVSETPLIELESHFLFPSKDAIKESVIMSGHLEIASKTNSVGEASEDLSKPSVALQGTEFHAHTISDL